MSAIVPLALVRAEAAELRRAGVPVDSMGNWFWRGPAWVLPLIDRCVDLSLLGAVARAVVAGLDPNAVLSVLALGGLRAVAELVERPPAP